MTSFWPRRDKAGENHAHYLSLVHFNWPLPSAYRTRNAHGDLRVWQSFEFRGVRHGTRVRRFVSQLPSPSDSPYFTTYG
jgi:hypothetical protein